jgi:hypothetical protein
VTVEDVYFRVVFLDRVVVPGWKLGLIVVYITKAPLILASIASSCVFIVRDSVSWSGSALLRLLFQEDINWGCSEGV